jgi:hypothetical protein
MQKSNPRKVTELATLKEIMVASLQHHASDKNRRENSLTAEGAKQQAKVTCKNTNSH